MALPKLDVPSYEITLPLSKKQIKFRPFLVKEQKVLLMAMESNDAKSVQTAILDVLNVCILTPNFEIFNTPIIDIEYLFLHLRAKSVGEVVESKYRCNNEVTTEEGESKECGNVMEVKINLTEIEPIRDVEVDAEIHLTDKIIVKMKFPEFSIMRDSVDKNNITEITFNLIASCIEYIYDGQQFYYANEVTQEELVQFVENLSQEQFEKMEEFFNNMPRLTKKVYMTCKKCGYYHHFEVEGLEDFFG